MKKKIITSVLLGICLYFSLTTVTQAQEFHIDAKGAMAVDAKTGQILFEQNSSEVLSIASTTKLLSMYLIYEQLAQQHIQLTDQVAISPQVSALSLDPDLSNVALYEDQTYSVESLIYAGFLESANAAVLALAEHIAGSEAAFVDQMRAKLASWQITDGLIVNSTGLPNEYLGDARYPGSQLTDENQMTTKDMLIVARHLVLDFPDVLTVTQTPTYEFYSTPTESVTITNTNQMLPSLPFAYEGVNGLKTGTTDLAGACFVASTIIDGQEILTAVYDVTDGLELAEKRFTETARLLDYIKGRFVNKQVLTANTPLDQTITIKEGQQDALHVYSTTDLRLWDQQADPGTLEVTPVFDQETLVAPIASGQQIGQASVTLSNNTLGYLAKTPTVVIASEDTIEKAHDLSTETKAASSFFKQVMKKITSFFLKNDYYSLNSFN